MQTAVSMPSVHSLPTELWHQICKVIRGYSYYDVWRHDSDWFKSLQTLSLVSHTLRSTAQPQLFRTLILPDESTRLRIGGIAELFESRPEGGAWVRNLRWGVSAVASDLLAIVSALLIKMKLLQVIDISTWRMDQKVFAQVFRSRNLRHLTYRSDFIPAAFDESAFIDMDLAAHELIIRNVERTDCQLLLRQSRMLTTLKFDGMPNLPPSTPSCHQIIKLAFNAGPHALPDNVLDFLEVFGSVEDLEIFPSLLYVPHIAHLMLGLSGRKSAVPRLRKLKAPIHLAAALVPSCPVTNLHINCPPVRNYRVAEETWKSLSGGSVPLERLFVQGGSWHNDLLKHISEQFPELTVLRLSLDLIPTRQIIDYLLDPKQPLPTQMQSFSTHCRREGAYRIEKDLAHSILNARPFLKELRLQGPDVWFRGADSEVCHRLYSESAEYEWSQR